MKVLTVALLRKTKMSDVKQTNDLTKMNRSDTPAHLSDNVLRMYGVIRRTEAGRRIHVFGVK